MDWALLIEDDGTLRFVYRLQYLHQADLKCCSSRCSEGEQQLSWREAGPAVAAPRHRFIS